MQPTDRPGGPSPHPRRAAFWLLLSIDVGLCAWPFLIWARDPALFDDDLTRVGSLRRDSVAGSLLRPFNEHLAPLFEMVGWLAWWAVGGRVEAIAGGFRAALLLAYLAAAITLGAVVRLELRSSLAGLVAVAWFALATPATETVLWYSASSFQWAAATALAAWFAATMALRSGGGRRRGWLIGSALLAAAAPLFSAIGALAGPLATLRLILDDPVDRRGRLARAATPLAGTIAYGALILARRGHGDAVASSVREHLDLGAAAWAAARAPVLALIPRMIGFEPATNSCPDGLAVAATVALILGVLLWAWKDRRSRGLLVVGLWWIVGGYLLTYSTRAKAGDRWIFAVGRYHLFPEVGLICWAATALGPVLGRWEARRPRAGLVAVVGLAALLAVVQVSAIRSAAEAFRFPDQGRAIAAGLRLEAACRAEGVPLAQAIRVIDPVEPRWFPRSLPFHPLLYLFGPDAADARRPDAEARSRLLARLDLDDREAIFGGLDSAPYRSTSDHGTGASVVALRESARGEVMGQGGARLAFVEFVVPTDAGEIATVRLGGIEPGARLQLGWSGEDGTWTTARGVRWTVASRAEELIVARLPHWRAGLARRFRLVRRARPWGPAERPVVEVRFRSGPR